MEERFRKYYQALCSYAFSFLHDGKAAEDTVQDTFVRIIRTRKVFESDLHFRIYIYHAVRNECLDRLNRNSGTVTLPEEAGEGEPDESRPDINVVRAETVRRIRQAIAALPPRYREVFMLAYVENLKNEEIASRMGISVNTVKAMRQRAKEKMRSLLRGLYPLFITFITLQ